METNRQRNSPIWSIPIKRENNKRIQGMGGKGETTKEINQTNEIIKTLWYKSSLTVSCGRYSHE